MDKKDKQIRVAVRLPEDLKNDFMTLCEEKAINSSALIRKWIEDWTNQQKPNVPKEVIELYEPGTCNRIPLEVTKTKGDTSESSKIPPIKEM